jgi:hypothetical protein
MEAEDKKRLLEYYQKEKEKTLARLDTYQKNYQIPENARILRGIEFDAYEKARIEICKIEDEPGRMKQTAVLQIRRILGNLDSLDKVLDEIK